MAAHLRSIVRPCRTYGCKSNATKELRNTSNAVIGEYCTKHAQAELKTFKRQVGES